MRLYTAADNTEAPTDSVMFTFYLGTEAAPNQPLQ
jgi:hypothetical protein